MRIEVNVEKFKNDKEYYNRKYCNYILESWERYHAAMVKKLQKLKRQSSLEVHKQWCDYAEENIAKIKDVMSYL